MSSRRTDDAHASFGINRGYLVEEYSMTRHIGTSVNSNGKHAYWWWLMLACMFAYMYVCMYVCIAVTTSLVEKEREICCTDYHTTSDQTQSGGIQSVASVAGMKRRRQEDWLDASVLAVCIDVALKPNCRILIVGKSGMQKTRRSCQYR